MTGYTRQEIFNSGDVIEAAHGNNELNQIVSAFAQVTGHRHNGTAAEGAFIPLISNAANTDKVEVVTGGAKTTGTHQVTGVLTADVGVTATTNGFTATAGDITATAGNVVLTTGNVTLAALATVDGRDVSVDGTKLDGIETAATADQTNAEIKTAYELNANTNAFDDAEQTKLAGIETLATADQTNAEIKTAYELNANTNEFSDAEQTKLAAIETAATADQTAAEVVFTATGNIIATDVQAAIAEVDTEKAALAGATFTGAVTVPGFTSTGIDDNCTGERLQLGNSELILGNAGITYNLVNASDTTLLAISGGTAGGVGGNLLLFGSSHGSLANDIVFRAGTTSTLAYDDSASLWDFQQNQIILDQGTADNGLINFQATINADAVSAISSLTTSGATTHHIQVEINGTTFWIAGSTTDPS
jgi:hypothetical protein